LRTPCTSNSSPPFVIDPMVNKDMNNGPSQASAAAASAFLGVAFLADAAFFGAAFLGVFLAEGLAGSVLFLVTRPDFVLPRTFFSSTTAGACWSIVSKGWHGINGDCHRRTAVGVFLARLVLVLALGFAAALVLVAAVFLGAALVLVAVFLGAAAFFGAAVLALVAVFCLRTN